MSDQEAVGVLDEDAGDLKATLFLDFCLQEIAPSVYNRAIADAQAYFTGRVQDFCWSLEHLRCSRGRHRAIVRVPPSDREVPEPEFGYWLPKDGRPGRRLSNRS
jgi:hypothetical protein